MSERVLQLLETDELRIGMGRLGQERIRNAVDFNSYVFKLLSLLDENYKKVSVIIMSLNPQLCWGERMKQ